MSSKDKSKEKKEKKDKSEEKKDKGDKKEKKDKEDKKGKTDEKEDKKGKKDKKDKKEDKNATAAKDSGGENDSDDGESSPLSSPRGGAGSGDRFNKEWKDEAARAEVVTRVKTCLSAVAESKKLAQRDYLAVAETVARSFMRRFHKLDITAIDWIEAQCKRETMLRLKALGNLTTDQLTRDLVHSESAPIPVMPMAIDALTAPSSLLLPRASYLKDPFYHRKLHVPNPNRQKLEEILEQGTFLHPGCGTLKVLTVVPVKVHTANDRILMQFAAVVRDWTGAFALFFLEASADATTTTVYAAYPILSHVDFPTAGFTSLKIHIDDVAFTMSFQNQDSANMLHYALKMAMASMYGHGHDDHRIITMRALSVELSASDGSYYPPNVIKDITTLMRIILSEERREGSAMDEEFAALAVQMRSTPSRDAALRLWVKSVYESSRTRRSNPVFTSNHVRVIEVAAMHPCPHDDVQLTTAIPQNLSTLQQDQSEYLRKRIDVAKVIYRLNLPVVDGEDWLGRAEREDVAFERCFEPVEGSDVALQIQAEAAEKKALFAARYTPPGIYLTVLCFCEDQVLATNQGTLLSELISPAPSDDELGAFTADSPDFKWILMMGGSNDNWSKELTAAEELSASDSIVKARRFDVIGANTFRRRFVHAVSRLRSGSGLPSLGMLFDVPVRQKEVGCAHIITVLRVQSTDLIPVGLGQWRDYRSIESDLYLHSMSALPSSRLEYLPTSPKNCIRFVKAAIDHRNSLDHRPTAGFYLGHIAVNFTVNGPQVLVPEANRHLPPMVLVSETMPTLTEMRWIQSLNERKRRNQTFGLPATGVPKDFETFEEAFSRGVEELETAMDIPIEMFYDFELFVLDEAQSMMGVFAVSLLNRYDQRKPKVPMCLVPAESLEHQAMSCLWPRVYKSFNLDRINRQRRFRTELQVVASDELLRFKSDSAIAERFECEKFLQLFCWSRTIVSWFRKDRRTLVAKCGGDEDVIISKGIEDVVVTSVSNYASSLDPNLITMKERILKAAVDPSFSYTTLLSNLREAERMLIAGYAQRATPIISAQMAANDKRRLISTRTFDDMYADEVDDDHPRPPTDYHLPCTLEELLFKDADEDDAGKYFMMQSIVKEVVEIACVDSVDVGVVKEVGSIINDMISILEATDDLVDGAQLLSLQEEAEEEALKERETFQEKWLGAFLGADTSTIAGASGGSIIRGPVEENATALFYDGSAHFINTFDDGLKICLAQAMNSHHQLEQLMAVATSTVEALDLVNAVQGFATCLSRREALLGVAETGRSEEDYAASQQQPGLPLMEGSNVGDGSVMAGGGGGDSAMNRPANEVILVSKEFEDFTVPSNQPLRCLLLASAAGKVRFPTVPSHALSVVANYLRCNDFNLPSSLRRIDLTTERAEAALDVAMQFKAPLLCLRLASILFASQGNNEEYFTAPAVIQLQTLFSDSFMFEYPLRDWLQIETLGGEAIAAAMDVMWYVRFTKEALQEMAQHNNNFSDHEGSWKQVFAETRIKAFLSSGVHAVTTEEVTLWSQSLGRLVEYLSFRELKISDAEVEVLAQVCPNLRSLDLSYTAITERAIRSLVEHCPRLVECSVAGTQLGTRDIEIIRRHCAENKRKMEL